jgi:hypothetical protein
MLRGTREQARARVLPDLERLLAELPAPGGETAPARGTGA